jgi:hypothetical protein
MLDDPLTTAVIGLASGLVLAAVSSWLSGREQAADDVRSARLGAYPAVWRRTSVVSRWPRTNAGPSDLLDLHLDLRRWYYESGGLFLSERARARYGDLQAILEAYLGLAEQWTEPELPHAAYDDVMEIASRFRTALTEDLESRRQRSLVAALTSARRHGALGADATRRVRAVQDTGRAAAARYRLAEADRRLADGADRSDDDRAGSSATG